MPSSIFVYLSAAVSVALSASDWVEPWFCHGLNCPRYTNPQNLTIDRTSIQIREYQSALWASTLVENTNLHDAEETGFQRDFDYIDGDNTAKTNIPMTSPVLNYIEPAQGPYCTTNFTVSFYVPYAYQPPNNGPPAPTESTVYLSDIKAMTVAVLAFDGFGEDDVVIAEAAKLNKLLSQSGLSYDENNWYLAGYDPPFRLSNRHNEIWIQIFNYTMN